MVKFTFNRLLARWDQAADMANASSKISDASNAGQTAINSYDPTAASGAAINQGTNLTGTAMGQNAAAVNPLAAAVKANPTVQSLFQTGQSLYNVPQLATQATNLQNRMNNLEPASYAGVRGFDIDNTDRQNSEAASSAYLQPELNQATNNYNTASGLAQGFMNAGVQQNLQNLLPAQQNASMVGNEIQQEQTGWNASLAAQLNGLMQKMQSGVSLSNQEIQTAQALAQTEESYNQAVTQANSQVQAAQIGQQYKQLAPNETLYNTGNATSYTPLAANIKGLAGTF